MQKSRHRDHIFTREGIGAKCDLTTAEKLIAAILDRFGAKGTCPDDKFQVRVKDQLRQLNN